MARNEGQEAEAARRASGGLLALVRSLPGEVRSVFSRMAPYRFAGETRACELCDGTDHEVVGRRDRYGNRLRTVLCRGCGLVFTNPMPTEAEVDAFYRLHYRKYYHNDFAPTAKAIYKARRGAEARVRALRPFIPAGAKVVDVGASSGEAVWVLRREGFDASGVEPNAAFAAYARAQYGVPMREGGWQDVEIPPGSVDFVTTHHAVEHFRHPLAALRRMRSWLKPGGLLEVSVPNIENPDRTPYGRFHFAHLHNFNHASLVMMAARAGLELVGPQDERSTGLVFRLAAEDPAATRLYPDNYARMSRFFATYTNRRHFLSAKPYRRWVRRMKRLGGVLAKAHGRPARAG